MVWNQNKLKNITLGKWRRKEKTEPGETIRQTKKINHPATNTTHTQAQTLFRFKETGEINQIAGRLRTRKKIVSAIGVGQDGQPGSLQPHQSSHWQSNKNKLIKWKETKLFVYKDRVGVVCEKSKHALLVVSRRVWKGTRKVLVAKKEDFKIKECEKGRVWVDRPDRPTDRKTGKAACLLPGHCLSNGGDGCPERA